MNVSISSVSVTPGCGVNAPSKTYGTELITLNSVCTDSLGICSATNINENYGAICNSQNICELYFPLISAKTEFICDGKERSQGLFGSASCTIQCTRSNRTPSSNTGNPGSQSPSRSNALKLDKYKYLYVFILLAFYF